MNKIDLLKEFKDMLNHNLLCYSSNGLMNKPSKKYVKEWELTQEKIGLLEEIMEDVKKYKKEDVWYLVRNDEYRVLGSFYTLNEAISFAEKKKKVQEWEKPLLHGENTVFWLWNIRIPHPAWR